MTGPQRPKPNDVLAAQVAYLVGAIIAAQQAKPSDFVLRA